MVDKYVALYEEYAAGKTLDELAESSGLTKQAISKGFKKRGFQTRGLSGTRNRVSVLATFDDEYLRAKKEQWDTLPTLTKGTIAESMVKSLLSQIGFDVWQPFTNNHRCDLGILQNGRLIRIQVKSATYDLATKRYRTMLQTRDKAGNHIGYKQEDIDFFIVFCPGLIDLYIIPAEQGITNPAVNMLPHRERIFKQNKDSYDWEQHRNAFHLFTE